MQSLAGWLKKSPLFRVRIVPDILPYKHTKLMYNAAIGPIAAAAGLDNGQLLSIAKPRCLFFELLRENYSILHDAGVRLETIGPFHPATVDRILHRKLLARALAWAFYPSLRGSYCSMNADLVLGRTEVDNYNRYLIDLAGDRPCSLNRRTYDLIKRMERERIPPSLAMLDHLATG
jgi:2-dehydropantoate 2-reductase